MIVNSKLPISLPSVPYHAQILENCARFHKEDPQKKAFVNSADESQFLTFGDVHKLAFSLAGWFVENGFKKGDIVLLYLHNSWQFLVTCLGAWAAGLVVSPASPQFTEYEVVRQIEDSTATIVVTDKRSYPHLRSVATKLKKVLYIDSDNIPGVIKFSEALKSRPLTSCVPVEMDKDLIVLPYSSGTTGAPKGVMVSHMNYAVMLEAYKAKYRADFVARGFDDYIPPEAAVSFLPLYHAMGLFGACFAIYNGTTQILMKKFHVERFLKHIQDYSLMAVTMVPAAILMMANSPLLDKYDLSSLIYIISGSAPLSKSVMEKMKKKLPDVAFIQGYGMTEMSVASHLGTIDAPEGSIGQLVPGSQMKVIDEEGNLCGPRKEGELWIKGPQVMKGYWKRPEETANVFDSDGFMRTGDIVYFDEDGWTFITDRVKELIKVHAKQVAPAELESIILELPHIHDACVVGIPDEKYGEIPKAFVVSDDKNAKIIIDHVAEKCAHYKQLRGGVEFVDAIPRTPTGKLLRRKLKEMALKEMKSKL